MKGGFKRRYQLATATLRKVHRYDGASSNEPAGFTIVEVLIVLAVTGGLFISAALLIAGRQNSTQFQQAINNVKTQIQQTVNDVNAGFYPSSANFSCQATGGGGISFSAGAKEQGTNQDCMFLGKVLQFKVQGSGSEKFLTYAVAGLRQNSDSTEVTTYTQASPTVVVPSGDPTAIPTASNVLQYGLTTYSMKFTSNGATKNIGAIGFLNTLASYNSNGLAEGSQNVVLAPVDGTSLGATPTQAVTAINAASGLKSTPMSAPTDLKAEICFQSGGTDQSGLVTIGSNGRQLSVTLSIKANKTCL